MKIIKPDLKVLNKQNVNINKIIEFENNYIDQNNDFNNYNLNLIDLFVHEREKNKNYKIYGKIDFSSILNNLNVNYFYREDFFIKYSKELSKNIVNSFDVYLLHKSEEYIDLTDKYIYKYKVIATPKDIDILKVSISKNIFYEDQYFYNVKKNINIDNIFDARKKPITELFLYFKYKDYFNKNEKIYRKDYDKFSDENNFKLIEVENDILTNDDEVYGSLFNIDKNLFDENIINKQEYYIDLEIENEQKIRFKYNPFVEIKIREYSSNINFSNIKLKDIISIPNYAIKVDNFDNYIWRDIYEYGYIDPINNSGLDFPFINNMHYVYNNINLNVIPDIDNQPTKQFFNEIIINSYNTNLFNNNSLKILKQC